MLPASAGMTASAAGPRMKEYFRRMGHFGQMDFDLVLAHMWSLILAPESAFREAKNRKLTKNHWSRDDPAFLVLLMAQIVFVCISYFVAVCVPLGMPFSWLLKLIFCELVLNFLVAGILVSTVFWFFANKYLQGRGQMHEVRQQIEWSYAFDIHCNAFFTMLIICSGLQLLMLPWLLHPGLLARALSNGLYAVSFSMYLYITFRGYLELPFLDNQECFLYPVFFIALCFALSLVTNFNATSYVINSWVADH
ncbi:Protein unc-50-like protein [Diplonema papillatum]|nr:Protein unc-50-like protein [Diplonema papillatum]|eukprot:gene2239-3452_t